MFSAIQRLLNRLVQPYCHKSAMGYNCHHRNLANGMKECD